MKQAGRCARVRLLAHLPTSKSSRSRRPGRSKSSGAVVLLVRSVKRWTSSRVGPAKVRSFSASELDGIRHRLRAQRGVVATADFGGVAH